MQDKVAVVVLAAGMGTRLKSNVPKVLHQAGGRSLLGHVLNASKKIDADRCCVVIGPDMDAVANEARAYIAEPAISVQTERLGTGHAVMQALPDLAAFQGTVVVLYGDVPLVQPQTLTRLLEHVSDRSPMAVLGFEARDPAGYGRLIVDADGHLLSIREELDATHEERQIKLCNSGILALKSALVKDLLPALSNENAKGEYYLTDLVGLCRDAGHRIAYAVCPETEVMGVNDRAQLARVESQLQDRYRAAALAAGVGMIDPSTVYLSHDTRFGRDVILHPFVVIGRDVCIGDATVVHSFSHLEQVEIGAEASIGPYARLRGGAVIGDHTRIGNFVEMKNTNFAHGAKASHLSYVGDSDVGEGANIGAGTITCNYDGFEKHRTVIGAESFIGSNSALVAPLSLGARTNVGAGSVVTRNVPDDAMIVVRGEAKLLPERARTYRSQRAAAKKKRQQQEV